MQPVLLLHGAIGSAAQLEPLASLLKSDHEVHLLNFSGHGGEAYSADFSIQLFANEVLAYMDEKGIAQASIFGYSMGGYVGMYLAKHHSQRITCLVTLATKYHWDEVTAAKEVQMLDPEKIAVKIPAFAQTLANRHAPADWKQVLKQTTDMMLGLGKDNPLQLPDYTTINTPVLVLLGDRDKMVSLDETVNVYKALPAAQLGILPATQHPIEQVNMEQLVFFIRKFIG